MAVPPSLWWPPRILHKNERVSILYNQCMASSFTKVTAGQARSFVHLHTHSHYSLLEALPKLPEMVAAAKADGQTALALTDNGNLYGAIEFYKECKEQGIKPIIGVDFYVAPRTRRDKEHRVDDRHSRLVLLAANEAGDD